jgi:hypothetical protein
MRSKASFNDRERLMRESTTRIVNMSLYAMIFPPQPLPSVGRSAGGRQS